MLMNSTYAAMAIVLVAFFAACDLRNELTSSADDVGDSFPSIQRLRRARMTGTVRSIC